MAHYISKVRSYEILQMKAEFWRDDLGFVWFVYARDIQVRKNKNKEALSSDEAKKEAKKIQMNKEKMRKNMIDELTAYEEQQGKAKSKVTERMLSFMNSHYQELKDEVGINEQANLGENDYANDNILT